MRAARLAMLLVASAGIAFGAARPLPKFDRVMTIDTPRAVVDLTMTDQDGKATRVSELAGAARHQHQLMALLREHLRERRADAGGGARDQGNGRGSCHVAAAAR